MQVSQSIKDNVALLKLHGRFDVKARLVFCEGYERSLGEAGVMALEIDLGDVDYMDSSALGMLLLVREHAKVLNIELRLVQCNDLVLQILDIANFRQIFTISMPMQE